MSRSPISARLERAFPIPLTSLRSLGRASGGRHAAPAWAEFYRAGWRDSGREWAPPPGLVKRTIDPTTGYLATEWCPDAAGEWFKEGTEPNDHCPIHNGPPEPDPWWRGPVVSGGEVGEDVGRAVEKEAERFGKRVERTFKKIFRW